MGVIGVEINEVLRDFIGQLTYTYEKYIGELNLKEGDVKNLNLIEYYKFNSINDMNKFIYTEAALEIFGHADQLHDNLMNDFNMFLMDIKDDEQHTIQLISREADKAIPSTLFFLSKLGCRAENIRFVSTFEEQWEGIDILISANPTALSLKPDGKMTIKIKSSYNEFVDADFEFESILEFINDETLINKILNSEITKLK